MWLPIVVIVALLHGTAICIAKNSILVRLVKSTFQKSGILEKKSGVYQEKNSSKSGEKSGEKSGGFLLDIQELLHNS